MPLLRRAGRPGLLGIAARTAVAAGTATAVSGAVAQRQQARVAGQQTLQDQRQVASAQIAATNVPPVSAASFPPAPAAPVTDVVVQLQQLGELHQQGLLSAEEFALAKQQLLGG